MLFLILLTNTAIHKMDIIIPTKKRILTLFYFSFKMSLEGTNDTLENDEAMLTPSIPELEARIQVSEVRNADLELRNIALTKTVSLLSNLEIDPQTKINKVNKHVTKILQRYQERISAITHLETNDSNNQAVYDIVDLRHGHRRQRVPHKTRLHTIGLCCVV